MQLSHNFDFSQKFDKTVVMIGTALDVFDGNSLSGGPAFGFVD